MIVLDKSTKHIFLIFVYFSAIYRIEHLEVYQHSEKQSKVISVRLIPCDMSEIPICHYPKDIIPEYQNHK